METVVSATDARVHFGELMRRAVETGEPITVERGGNPYVVVVSAEVFARLQANQRTRAEVLDRVRRHRERLLEEIGDRELPDIAELIRDMREERSQHQMEVFDVGRRR